jgi:hypothetical protein
MGIFFNKIPKEYQKYPKDIRKIYGAGLFKKSLGNAIISNNQHLAAMPELA